MFTSKFSGEKEIRIPKLLRGYTSIPVKAKFDFE